MEQTINSWKDGIVQLPPVGETVLLKDISFQTCPHVELNDSEKVCKVCGKVVEIVDYWPTFTPELQRGLTAAHSAWWAFSLTDIGMTWGNAAALRLWRKPSLQAFLDTDWKSDLSTSAKARLQRIESSLRLGEQVIESWTFYPETGHGKRVAVTADCHMNGINMLNGQFGFLCEAIERSSTDVISPDPPTTQLELDDESSKSSGLESRREIESENLRMIESYRHAPYGILLLSFSEANGDRPSRFQTVSANPEVISAFGVNFDLSSVISSTEKNLIYTELHLRGEWAGEVIMQTKNGPCWFRIDAQSMNDPVTAGKLILLYLVNIDRTKKLEADLLKAREMAESGNRAKGEFLAIVSHEIRTPLNSICGMTTLLLDTEQTLSPDQHKSLSLIRSSGDALLAILEDVLDFSRIESGKLDLHIEQFDVRMCVEDVLDLFRSQIVQKNVFVSYFVDPSVPRCIISDEKRLRQCIWNLIANSLKFTPPGGRISILVNKTDMVPDGLLFTIKDTGIGIAQQKQSVIFSHFAQADSGTSRKFGGSGLGLALVRRLTEIMGGKVWLEESIPDVGSTFCFCISAPEVECLNHINGGDSRMAGKSFSVLCDDLPTKNLITSICTSLHMVFNPESNMLKSYLAFVDHGKWETIRQLKKHGVKVVIVEYLRGSNPAISSLSPKTWQEYAAEKVPVDAHVFVPFREATLQEIIMSIPEKDDLEPSTMDALSISPLPTTLPRRKSAFDESLGITHPLKILCVDDNHVNLLLIKKFLEKMMFKVVDCATDGNVAVEMASILENGQSKYDLILTDINSTFVSLFARLTFGSARSGRNHRHKTDIVLLPFRSSAHHCWNYCRHFRSDKNALCFRWNDVCHYQTDSRPSFAKRLVGRG